MPQATFSPAIGSNYFSNPTRVSDDEPYWIAFSREYAIPAIVFMAIIYYLIMHLCIPLRNFEVVHVKSSKS
ncbi:unnamed protein product [Phytomonas sp. Hart1]|nr:unnamed protein product [Phytomonas sp. Hart1]|eukprot:CCW70765.1 unnamed protein product [Phytomonas sp. isolate Hart1]